MKNTTTNTNEQVFSCGAAMFSPDYHGIKLVDRAADAAKSAWTGWTTGSAPERRSTRSRSLRKARRATA